MRKITRELVPNVDDEAHRVCMALCPAMHTFLQRKGEDRALQELIAEIIAISHEVNNTATHGLSFRKNGQREILLRLPDVIKKVGLKKSAIYKLIKGKEFPAAVNIGARARAWREAELDDWIANKVDNHETN